MRGKLFKTWARRIAATILYFNVLVFVCSLLLFFIDSTFHPYMDGSDPLPIFVKLFYDPLRYVAGNYFMFILPFVAICTLIIFVFSAATLITRNAKLVRVYQALKFPIRTFLICLVPVLTLFCVSFLASVYRFDLLWSLSPIVLLLIIYIGGFGTYMLFRKLFLTFPVWLKKVLNILAALVLIALILPILYIGSKFILPEQPSLYVDMRLDDPDGRYVLNYDGDYWLTYYRDENECYTKKSMPCTVSWKKTGNTSITDAPFPLDPLLDKPVRVTGEFVPITGPIYAADKGRVFCMSGATCVMSNGPGTWYMSPLKIITIKLE